MAILEVKDLEVYYGVIQAIKGISFEVNQGEIIALIGANGAGKTTTLQTITGLIPSKAGTITYEGKDITKIPGYKLVGMGIAHVPEGRRVFAELSVLQNLKLGAYTRNDKNEMEETLKEIYERFPRLEERKNQMAGTLSGGEQQMLAMGRALMSHPKLIVMDEPSSTLSKREFETLLQLIKDLKAKGITLIYISHHLEELFMVGDRITILRDGKFVACRNASEINEDHLVEYMTGAKVSEKNEYTEAKPLNDEKVLEVKGLTNHKVRNISFDLHKGEVLGLYGLVGAGRTEVIRSIFGADPYEKGEIKLHGRPVHFRHTGEAIANKIGLIPENRKTQGLVQILPVWENMTMVALDKCKKNGIINYGVIRETCELYKKSLNVKTPSINTVIQNLSGGNQQKVIIAKWLFRDCDILLIDEPTQGIDVMVKEEIYKIIRNLADEGKSMIVVSSELDELLRICDNIIVMFDGKEVMTSSKENFNPDKILSVSVTGRNES